MIRVIDEHHLQVGERRWFGEFHSESVHNEHIDWESRQFLVRFESKWSVSVIWGFCTYSDNHDLPWHEPGRAFVETPETVEVAILHHDREGVQPNGDPYGYLDAEQLNVLLEGVSRLATTDTMSSEELT